MAMTMIIKDKALGKEKFYLAVQAGAGSVYYELVLRPKFRPTITTGDWSKEFELPL